MYEARGISVVCTYKVMESSDRGLRSGKLARRIDIHVVGLSALESGGTLGKAGEGCRRADRDGPDTLSEGGSSIGAVQTI